MLSTLFFSRACGVVSKVNLFSELKQQRPIGRHDLYKIPLDPVEFSLETKIERLFENCKRRMKSGMIQEEAVNNSGGNASSDLLWEQKGHLGVITLNRPKALNSLTTDMVEKLGMILNHWKCKDDVSAVLIKGAGGKAFCAGGDVKAVVTMGRAGDVAGARRFFRSEYHTDAEIAGYKKPYISLLDGITMGGGAGISVHGSVRVATEKTVFSMPECAIGLFPDIGGSYFMPRMKDGLGLYLGLTGARLSGADVYHAGLATHYIPSEKIPDLESALTSIGKDAGSIHVVNKCIWEFQNAQEVPRGDLINKIETIIDIFSGKESIEEIYAACKRHNTSFGSEIMVQLKKGSPTSQRIVFEQMKRGSKLSLKECLRMECRISHRLVGNLSSDFYEGVDAALIRKDGCPHWNPDTLSQVSENDILKFFDPLDSHEELQLSNGGRTKL